MSLAATACALALGAGACTVGSGSGTASGELFVEGCNAGDTLMNKQAFELKPTFFAGEPIEDVCPPPGHCPGEHVNRLLIRMQRTGNRVEDNDTLYFDVGNALEVAKCVRGRIAGGQPDWDMRAVSNPDGTVGTVPWCDWGLGAGGVADGGVSDGGVLDGGADAGGADAGPAAVSRTVARISLSTVNNIRASFAPLHSCIEARLVGVGVPPGSWIEFSDFGSATQSDKAADARDEVVPDFKVAFGERLRATFHIELEDQRVTTAEKARDPVPSPRIGGVLDGNFDFDLERGRAAQPFP